MRTTDGFENYGTYHGFNYCEDDEMKNPNLYVELETSDIGGYMLAENNNLLLTEGNDNLFV